AHAGRARVREAHRARTLALVAAAAAILAALVLSPAGARMGDWIGDVVDPGSAGSLDSLPAPGRLLVVSDDGPWIVEEDGARRRLGDFGDATWSPGGLFVAAARGRQLVALEPNGDERWVRPAPGPVGVPRWSPDGFRIAYRSGDDLWVSIADNSGRWRLARGVGAAPPAWQPGRPPFGQVVAFSSGARIRIVEVDPPPGRAIATTAPGPVPRELWWTAGGRRLVSVTEAEIRVYDARGRLRRTLELPPRLRAESSAIDARGRRLAVAAQRADGRSSEVLLYRLDRDAPPRQLFAGPGLVDGLTWSIDSRVLVLGLPEADQWVFLEPRRRGRLEAVSGIRGEFAGGARPAGWCYAEPRDSRPYPPCSSGAAP
ncbi:MAG: WD40 repeat domain-containing protein, partial [Thermoleophilaceae bacterium]